MSIVSLGGSIGEYKGKPIWAYIMDDDGARYKFHRTAVETDGRVKLSQLASDELVVAPGLIYRRDRRLMGPKAASI